MRKLSLGDLDENGKPIFVICGKCSDKIPRSKARDHAKMCGVIRRLSKPETRGRYLSEKYTDGEPIFGKRGRHGNKK